MRVAWGLALVFLPGLALAQAPEQKKLDVSHVKPGQRYTYRTSIRAGERRTLITTTFSVIKVLPGKAVQGRAVVVQRTLSPGKADEVTQTKPRTSFFSLTRSWAPARAVLVGKETIRAAGRTWECRVYERKAYRVKTWVSAKFPFTIKVEQLGKPFQALVKIEGPGTRTDRFQELQAALEGLDDVGLGARWKRYYQHAVARLHERAKQLEAAKLEVMTHRRMLERDLAARGKKGGMARTIIAQTVKKYQEQHKADPKRKTYRISYSNPNEELSGDDARKRLRQWASEYRRKYGAKALKPMVVKLRDYTRKVGRIDVVVGYYQTKAKQLEAQQRAFEVKLPRAADLRKCLEAIAAAGAKHLRGEGVNDLEHLLDLEQRLAGALPGRDGKTVAAQQEALRKQFARLKVIVKAVGLGLSGDESFLKPIDALPKPAR